MAGGVSLQKNFGEFARARRSPRTQGHSSETEPARVVGARLSLSSQALTRLLSVSGSEHDFVLSSLDGSTSVRVHLAIATVPDAAVTLGQSGIELDWTASTLSARGQKIALTRMELRLLGALLERAPEVSPRSHLISRLWPGAKVCRDSEGALAVWICAIRRRFSALGVSEPIRTVRNSGYTLSL